MIGFMLVMLIEVKFLNMSESLFGRIFDSVGSSNSDLLLKTKGQVKVKYGNKYIDLIKDGNINYPKETIQKLINENIDSKIQKQEVQLDTNVTSLTEQIKKLKNDLANDIYSESLTRQWAIQDIIGGKGDVFNPDDPNNNSKLNLNSLGSKIIEEIGRSIEKDEATQNELINIKQGIGLDDQGKYVKQTQSVYIKEANSVVDSINILDEKLALQSENSANNENDLASKITSCETNINTIKNDYLKSSDKTELNEAITNENTRAISAEQQLQTTINQEINNVKTNISTLTTQINNLLPSNTIMLFYGNQIPSGWVVCDGTNNTPLLNSDIENVIYIIKQ